MPRRITMPGRVLVIVIAALALIVGGGTAFAAVKAKQAASCTPSPTITAGQTTSSFSVTCSYPTPAASTVTVTAPPTTVTVTGSPTSSTTSPTSTTSTSVTTSPTSTSSTTTTTAPTTTTSTAPTSSTTTSAPVGGAYPDATNTGVPAGTVLTKVPSQATTGNGWAWRASEGCVYVETAGVTLDALDVSGCIEVEAANVTISRTRITSSGDWWGIGVHGYSGAVIQDTTISGNGQRLEVGIKDTTGSSDIAVLRNNIADWTSGVQTSRGSIVGNFIHDPKLRSGDHINGTTHNGGRLDGSLLIQHNTILNSFDQTDAVSLFQDFGVSKNITVNDNILAGGSWTLYAGAGPKGPSSNIQITNNRFLVNNLGFGSVCCFDKAVASNVWSGNVVADGPNAGQTIPAP